MRNQTILLMITMYIFYRITTLFDLATIKAITNELMAKHSVLQFTSKNVHDVFYPVYHLYCHPFTVNFLSLAKSLVSSSFSIITSLYYIINRFTFTLVTFEFSSLIERLTMTF